MTRLVHPTPEAKWWANVRDTGKHLVWTGPRGDHGNPVFDYKAKRYQAMRIAFTMRTGRQPEGPVTRACQVELCVKPTCMEDARDRRILRVQLRALEGLDSPNEGVCPNGHQWADQRRYRPDGKPYCNACSNGPREAAA